ncbi:MAG: hypothetical protein WCK82_00380 [Bacteroidota bacterium]
MRSYDKIKNIQKANLITENLYLVNKNPSYLIENILSIDENDFENKNLINKFLFESIIENGIELDDLITENKEVINESIVIGAVLASGKLLDVIGVVFKKIYNFFVKKGWIKGNQIEKTYLEKAGEWIHENLIMGVFKIIATTLLGTIGGFVGVVQVLANPKSNGDLVNKIVSEENIKNLAATLFYASITIVGAQGLMTVAHSAIHGSHILHGVIEGVTSGTKLYELILLVLAFYSASYIEPYKPFKNKIPALAHAYGECLEGDKNIYNVIKSLPKTIKAGDTSQIECVNHHLNIHGGEQGSKDNHQTTHGEQSSKDNHQPAAA